MQQYDENKTKCGKLSNVAELIFCMAYGLDGFGKINHDVGIPFWMAQYNCSFRAIASLLYGSTYDSKLGKWRACVPNYCACSFDLDLTSLDNLPPVSNFDAHSLLQYKTVTDHLSRATDKNIAIQRILRNAPFPFLTSASMSPLAAFTTTPTTPTFQLSAIFVYLNFHQRVALALQIALALNAIFTFRSFCESGRFVLHKGKPVLGQPVVVCGTLASPCAYFIDRDDSVSSAKKRANRHKSRRGVSKTLMRFLQTRLQHLQASSVEPNILEPFVNLALMSHAHTSPFEHLFWIAPHNLTPPNIFVAFSGFFLFIFSAHMLIFFCFVPILKKEIYVGDQPNVVRITGWDAAEVMAAEIAQCSTVPGWLWEDIKPSPGGSLLDTPCKDTMNNIVRLSFIDKMEQLQPGYFQHVTASQKKHIGILGRLASKGLNVTNENDRAFHASACAAIAR